MAMEVEPGWFPLKFSLRRAMLSEPPRLRLLVL